MIKHITFFAALLAAGTANANDAAFELLKDQIIEGTAMGITDIELTSTGVAGTCMVYGEARRCRLAVNGWAYDNMPYRVVRRVSQQAAVGSQAQQAIRNGSACPLPKRQQQRQSVQVASSGNSTVLQLPAAGEYNPGF